MKPSSDEPESTLSALPAPGEQAAVIEEAKRLLQDITPGEWCCEHAHVYPGASLSSYDQMMCSLVGTKERVVGVVDKYWQADAPEVLPEHEHVFPRRNSSPDADFIAAAPRLIRQLLKVLDRREPPASACAICENPLIGGHCPMVDCPKGPQAAKASPGEPPAWLASVQELIAKWQADAAGFDHNGQVEMDDGDHGCAGREWARAEMLRRCAKELATNADTLLSAVDERQGVRSEQAGEN